MEELRAAVSTSADAYFVGWIWSRWIANGVSKDILHATGLSQWIPPDLFQKVTSDQPLERGHLASEFEQFLIRALVRDWGGMIENFVEQSGLFAAKAQQWSSFSDPVYALRILRNSFNHDWTVGKVRRDVHWEYGPYILRFYNNQDLSAPAPLGYEESDDILPLLHGFPPDAIRWFMMDVG